MYTTEFLALSDLTKYGSWIKSQDRETLYLYFGSVVGSESIDLLIRKIALNFENNHILIAKIDGAWAGTIHIAVNGKDVEFGIIVSAPYRKHGIASLMMDEAITWAQNRGYQNLYMHYINKNLPIRHLCKKHGLKPCNMIGESEAKLKLDLPSPTTYLKEFLFAQRNFLASNLILHSKNLFC